MDFCFTTKNKPSSFGSVTFLLNCKYQLLRVKETLSTYRLQSISTMLLPPYLFCLALVLMKGPLHVLYSVKDELDRETGDRYLRISSYLIILSHKHRHLKQKMKKEEFIGVCFFPQMFIYHPKGINSTRFTFINSVLFNLFFIKCTSTPKFTVQHSIHWNEKVKEEDFLLQLWQKE